MLKQNGCLRGTQEQFNRRDFIRVGSLSFLGINLSQALRLEAAFKQINEKSEKNLLRATRRGRCSLNLILNSRRKRVFFNYFLK